MFPRWRQQRGRTAGVAPADRWRQLSEIYRATQTPLIINLNLARADVALDKAMIRDAQKHLPTGAISDCRGWTLSIAIGLVRCGSTAGAPFVDLAKLRDYALDPFHPEGKHKARVFAAALGISRDDANWLCDQLLLAATNLDCTPGQRTEHGQRYAIDFEVTFHGRTTRLRSAWIVRSGEKFPRLTKLLRAIETP